MRRLVLGSLASLIMLPAHAGLLLFTADNPIGFSTGFEIVFDDTGDGLLQWDEIVSFSGARVGLIGGFVDTVLGIPEIDGFATFSFDPDLPFVPLNMETWIFRAPAGNTVACGGPGSAPCWSYSITSIAIPAPGTLALVLFGLLAFRNQLKGNPMSTHYNS